MTGLDLPPRRTLPPEVRDRIRTAVHASAPPSRTVRYRAPLAVAAGVAVLAAAAVAVGQGTAGTSGGHRPGTTPPQPGTTVSTTTAPGTDPLLTLTQPDAQSDQDLDHCATAAQTSPRAGEYPPRSAWQPVFTAVRSGPRRGSILEDGPLVRVTAFRANDGQPMFCEITEVFGEGQDRNWLATVSDPTAASVPLAMSDSANVTAVFVSRGLVAGAAPGIASMKVDLTCPHPDTGAPVRSEVSPAFQDGLFVVEVGGPGVGCTVSFAGFDSAGNEMTRGEWVYDVAEDSLTGPSVYY